MELKDLQTVYSLRDAFDMVEALAVDRINQEKASEAARKESENRGR